MLLLLALTLSGVECTLRDKMVERILCTSVLNETHTSRLPVLSVLWKEDRGLLNTVLASIFQKKPSLILAKSLVAVLEQEKVAT